MSKKIKNYSDYISHKFLKYTIILIFSMYFTFLLFMVLYVGIITVGGNHKKNSEISSKLNNGFYELYEKINYLSKNQIIINSFNDSKENLQKANTLLYESSNNLFLENTFILTDMNSKVIASNLYKGNWDVFSQNLSVGTIKNKLSDSNESIIMSTGEFKYGFDQNGTVILGSIINSEKGPKGYLFFTVKDSFFLKTLYSYNLSDITLTDNFNNILFTTSTIPPDPMGKFPSNRFDLEYQSNHIATRDDMKYYVLETPFFNNRLKLYTLSTLDFQIQMFFYGSILLLLISVLFVTLVLIILAKATKDRTEEIDSLIQVAHHIGNGELDYKAKGQQFNEFQVLNDTFNILSKKLQRMMKDNEELAEHKRILELKHLESQFNPHFMFNTLEAIRYQIFLDSKTASEMILKFANLMRYSMSYGETFILISTDIQFLEDYLILQKIRFGSRLEYSISMDPKLEKINVPKLLLQPIVENSLCHGANIKKNITIKINAKIHKDEIIVEVIDSGDGMSKDRLISTRERLTRENISGKHFGLYSVQRTLRLTYGEPYGLEINSIQGEGTKVTLTLPHLEGDKNNV